MSWQKKIKIALTKRKHANMFRIREVIENNNGSFIYFNQKKYVNFSSNDYLGLAENPIIIKAWKDGADYYGIGSASSTHISGYTVAHQELEKMLAEWLGYERALIFVSGFAANQAIIIALAGKQDCIIADRLIHASLQEAAKLSPAKFCRFVHNDITSLNKFLIQSCNGQKLVVTEGVFSMDGDSAPLSDIYAIAKQENSWLMVDDAHGIGVIGNNGRGSCDYYGIHPEILMITFGKAIGISGAAVLCNDELAQYLLQFSNHLIYSTSMPPAQVVALQAAIKVISSKYGDHQRNCLLKNIRIFREGATQLINKYKLSKSYSAIQPIIVKDNANAIFLANKLRKAGIWAVAIRPPTVPIGTSRLRLTLTSKHKPEDIFRLLEVLDDIAN